MYSVALLAVVVTAPAESVITSTTLISDAALSPALKKETMAPRKSPALELQLISPDCHFVVVYLGLVK